MTSSSQRMYTTVTQLCHQLADILSISPSVHEMDQHYTFTQASYDRNGRLHRQGWGVSHQWYQHAIMTYPDPYPLSVTKLAVRLNYGTALFEYGLVDEAVACAKRSFDEVE
jgi:hypothetical protein